jgi:hypothetical protein
MKIVASLLGFLIILAFTQFAYSDQQPALLLTVQPVITPTLIKAPPVISGAVTDMNGIAVTNATVTVTILSKQTEVQTDGQGSFTVNLPSKLHVGEYVIEVQASKSLYSDALSYVEYTANPPLGKLATTPPLYYDIYTLYLGEVTSWNDNTGTCTIITLDSHKAINQACNPVTMGFGNQISGKSDSLLSVMQSNGTYKIFPASMYYSTIRLSPSLVPGYLNESWNSG